MDKTYRPTKTPIKRGGVFVDVEPKGELFLYPECGSRDLIHKGKRSRQINTADRFSPGRPGDGGAALPVQSLCEDLRGRPPFRPAVLTVSNFMALPEPQTCAPATVIPLLTFAVIRRIRSVQR